MSPRRLISGAVTAVLLLTCVLVLPGATEVERVGKSYETALPQYVQGYWPGEDPRLCIGDLTEGMPVAEAVAQFDATDVDMVMIGRCGEDVIHVGVFVVDELTCGGSTGHDGCHFRGEGSARDDDGLWVYASGPMILLNAGSDLTDGQWTAVIAHELGHLVGLGHTNRRDSIMRPGSTGTHADGDGHDGLTATDIAVIDQLYAPDREGGRSLASAPDVD